ncbi:MULTISPECIES: hypothetical protein [unclassified Ensifer]|uniref:hypothetical protein n=1 Tax=unclassified Ensifer TaxID=2633371 RepID=UPI00137AB899|nr:MULTISPECIES: hypothetical protein [unclassified Ensifer]
MGDFIRSAKSKIAPADFRRVSKTLTSRPMAVDPVTVTLATSTDRRRSLVLEEF